MRFLIGIDILNINITVKVEKKPSATGSRAKIQIEADGAYVEEDEFGEKKKLEKVNFFEILSNNILNHVIDMLLVNQNLK